jgi:hypothetical protein
VFGTRRRDLDPLFQQNLEDAAQRWTQIAPELTATSEFLDNCEAEVKERGWIKIQLPENDPGKRYFGGKKLAC